MVRRQVRGVHPPPSLRLQSGITLLDSLIAMMIVLITGLGSAYALNSNAVQQVRTDMKNEVVLRIREHVLANGGIPALCAAATKTFNVSIGASAAPVTLGISYACTDQEVTVGGSKVMSQQATFTSSTNSSLFGSPGTIQVSL
ncbi:hypothetical protein KSF73_02950 [Burkholderiaceae bacterium DAT-1]|nr:hypothetical protein [Burkholderiaceae bacterium DAT-1]